MDVPGIARAGWAVGVVAAFGLALLGCGVDTAADAAKAPVAGASACAETESFVEGACVYVIDNAEAYWSATAMEPAVFRFLGWTIQTGSDNPVVRPADAFDDKHPGPDTMLAQFASGSVKGPEGDLVYTHVMLGDVKMHYDVSAWAGKPGGSCSGAPWLTCDVRVDPWPGGNRIAAITYTIADYPLTIEVNNSLTGQNNRLLLVGDASTEGFLPDPKGRSGNANSIAPGDTAYFGLYRPAPGAEAGQPTFRATYQVDGSSSDLGGARIGMTFTVDPATGQIASASCQVNLPQAATARANCDNIIVDASASPPKIEVTVQSG